MNSEKEINIYLLDQLNMIEDVLEIAVNEDAPKTVEFLNKMKKRVETKLYQKSLLTEN